MRKSNRTRHHVKPSHLAGHEMVEDPILPINSLLPDTEDGEEDEFPLGNLAVVPVTCKAFSVQCEFNQGHNNFRILTLTIVDGVVTDIQKSDCYASFEFIDQLNVLTDKACNLLNMRWKDGSCLG